MATVPCLDQKKRDVHKISARNSGAGLRYKWEVHCDAHMGGALRYKREAYRGTNGRSTASISFSSELWGTEVSAKVRKSVMSVVFLPAVLGPEMAAPILWAPGIFGVLSAGKPLMACP